jgi:hypothetical protein
MIAATYYVSWNSDVVRTWLYALLAVTAVVVVFPVMVAVMPTVIGCCAYAAPVVGKLLLGAVIIAAYAVVMKPK